MSSKKTSSISFRIDEEYEKVLRTIAKENKISLNTLANQIFGNYVEFEIYAKKFGTLRMSTDTLRRILNNIDEKTLIDIATRGGAQEAKEFILFKWKKITLDSVTDFIKIYFDLCGYGRCSLEKTASNIVFSVHHDLKEKGSLFLKQFLESLIKTTLEKDCDTTITEDTITISFQA
ncbi:hypothetical protein NZNM25_04930 [Nitrosopumilus zosterae]|uniref:Uncharacterized protein n=1 Tax=Nitrosopumilus zosterae TaxID=718286 RepID=A0A2S2KPV5_9ARCH|nr:hypothetical protein [Nitrosopumilus zosterae]BDQ31497.1 hypothetical protein NZOSNM25_001617 [Nitrosopumilus zosterae]GBH33702.1 hypothetical protein NZNM25_04930 [Nitrosopumilus zosterae]